MQMIEERFLVSLSLSWMENLFFLISLYFSFFDSLFVCILKSGRWDGFLCDSFVMDADGERFLLVSPPDYEMKTDFSLICGSDQKAINIDMTQCEVNGIFFICYWCQDKSCYYDCESQFVILWKWECWCLWWWSILYILIY